MPVGRVLIRTLAIASSLLMILSFSLFALDQARSASRESVNGVSGITTPDQAGQSGSRPSTHHTTVRRAIDDSSDVLVAPFRELGVRSSNAWTEHGLLLLAGLLVYGCGLGFLARWSAARPRQRGPSSGDRTLAT
jgi:hypothetical protein